MRSIAHIREEDNTIQTVEEHLLGVKRLSELYGEKIGVKYIAGLAGVLHDLGKYTQQFSDYIYKSVYDAENAPSRGSVDHSTAGGKLLYELFHGRNNSNVFYRLLAEIVGNVIISHHSYLHDFLSPDLTSPYINRVHDKYIAEFDESKAMFFEKVMDKNEFDNYVQKAIEELETFLKKANSNDLEFQITFLTKYIFSCLIDADRTNTREFAENEFSSQHEFKPENIQNLFIRYYQKLKKKLDGFKNSNKANTPINVLRTKMSEECEVFAKKPSGIYTLSIPTGGGKTLASLRYALKHSINFNKKRIIYIVPYTTIIEQNANEVRRIIKDDLNLLEHHSNVILDELAATEDDLYQSTLKRNLLLAKDNWDSPIIFTTMVQFLNVFYAHGTRSIRRLHNLAESVIIFDEVQKVPTHCVSLFNRALNFLSKYAYSSILLCTATQPALDYVEHQLEISSETEIIKDLSEVISAFKRVEIVDKASSESYTNTKLTSFIFHQLEQKDSVLVILNTKATVRDLYKKLKDQKDEKIKLFHLSTSMCASHRNNILDEIREHLEKNCKVICISTQLIEAGVDISFDCVIRSLAGLDSIAQAAGRCNRHSEADLREVYVINHEEENLKHLREIAIGKEITRKMFIDLKQNPHVFGGDILSMQAMNRYFMQFYATFEHDLDYHIPRLNKSHVNLLGDKKEKNSYCIAYKQKWNEDLPLFLTNSYQTSAKSFQVIENETIPVLVPYARGKEYIAQFSSEQQINELSILLKKSQHYTVNLYEHEISLLNTNGQLTSLMDDMVLALKEGAYDDEYGVEIEGDSPLSFSMF